MRNTGLHKQYIQNVNFLPGGCGEAEDTFPHPPDQYLLVDHLDFYAVKSPAAILIVSFCHLFSKL
jgi:hypothetical protein